MIYWLMDSRSNYYSLQKNSLVQSYYSILKEPLEKRRHSNAHSEIYIRPVSDTKCPREFHLLEAVTMPKSQYTTNVR